MAYLQILLIQFLKKNKKRCAELTTYDVISHSKLVFSSKYRGECTRRRECVSLYRKSLKLFLTGII